MNGRTHTEFMSTIALIPARGGSKGIKRKNIKTFYSKPLIYWSIKIAQESEYIDRVIVSTEDKEIANVAKEFSAEVPFFRPKIFSKDDSPGIESVLHAIEMLPECKDILLMQPTSPIRKLEDIEGIFKLRAKYNSSSAVSITKNTKHSDLFFKLEINSKITPISGNFDIKPRQQYSDNYILNGSLYLSTTESILKNKSLITQDTLGYIMDPRYSVDIDTPFDWEIAEYIKSTLK